ncbi:MAG TPA: rhodanese-like domain-containing protein [Blastocatellia bacterium]|nr:rhodanese-like domain-containing protein [Blastocatellia bacterium]
MRLKKAIRVMAAIVACATAVAALQQVGRSAVRPRRRQDQAAQVDFITPAELKAKIEKNEPVTIVDLRAPNTYAQSDNTIKGSVHTAVRKVAFRLRDVPSDREVVTYCACPADESAIIGARALMARGFKRVRVLKGGWNAWLQAGGQVQPKPKT